MSMTELLQTITAFFGTLGFGLMFNIRGKKLWLGSLGGLLGWVAYLMFGLFFESDILCCFLASVLSSGYSEILARCMKTPATTFYIICWIPLIPGSSLYYSVASILRNDITGFLHYCLYTLEVAAALSAGVLLVTAGVRTIKRLLSEKNLYH